TALPARPVSGWADRALLLIGRERQPMRQGARGCRFRASVLPTKDLPSSREPIRDSRDILGASGNWISLTASTRSCFGCADSFLKLLRVLGRMGHGFHLAGWYNRRYDCI